MLERNSSDRPVQLGLQARRCQGAARAAARGMLAAALVGGASLPAGAREEPAPSDDAWRPDSVFVQWSASPRSDALGVGLSWNLAWTRQWKAGTAGAYIETLFSRWRADAPQGQTDNALVTQVGMAPVLRWQPAGAASVWFCEASLGVNLISPVYQSANKRFSTRFNFGEHIAVGRAIGATGRHEVALRVQHFSNAGIRHPNPGENFVQLRYTNRL
jgi:lipid A 3-O-deacylase